MITKQWGDYKTARWYRNNQLALRVRLNTRLIILWIFYPLHRKSYCQVTGKDPTEIFVCFLNYLTCYFLLRWRKRSFIFLIDLCYVVPTLSCGMKSAPIPHHRSKRVVGGTEAVPGAWNWHVSLKMNGIHYCSGSILSPNLILTTHHCFGVCCFYWFYGKNEIKFLFYLWS